MKTQIFNFAYMGDFQPQILCLKTLDKNCPQAKIWDRLLSKPRATVHTMWCEFG